MNVLITGATGFAGSHLCEFLATNTHIEIFGTTLDQSRRIEKITLIECNLLDQDNTLDLLKEVKPEFIIHLAAVASVTDAWSNPQEVLTNNINCQLSILESLVKLQLKPRVLIASTGQVYGNVAKEELPITEDQAVKPNNPYAVSKVTQELLGLQYFISHGIPVIISRAFNHCGPRQTEDFAVPAFASQIAEIEFEQKEPVIFVGNLEAERDFLDVRDVVRAYWELVNNGSPGEIYNICSGNAIKIQTILDLLINQADVKIEVKQDPKRLRLSDNSRYMGSNSKLIKETNWHPNIGFEQTITDTLNYYRELMASKERVT